MFLSGPELPAASGVTRRLVVLLHGLGANGDDLISLAPLLAEALPDTHFIAPDAPAPCDMAPFGYQWFSLREWTQQSMEAGAREAAPRLQQFLDEQLERLGLKPSQLGLVGFSQGTMMALYCALRREQPVGAVVGFSGALIGEASLGDELRARPPVCLIHGTADSVVPFSAMGFSAEALALHDIPCETHARPGLAHGIDEEGIAIAARFLKGHLR